VLDERIIAHALADGTRENSVSTTTHTERTKPWHIERRDNTLRDERIERTREQRARHTHSTNTHTHTHTHVYHLDALDEGIEHARNALAD
jgi:hypothetical protein